MSAPDSVSAPDSAFFVVGGPLRSDDPSYVERSADRELRDHLEQREYCYVLTPRQMGKSSLMARTARRLRAGGTRVAVIDLTAIGGEAGQPAEQWYYGLLYSFHRELRVRTPLKSWWDERSGLPPAQRFVEYFRELVLGDEEKVVVFLDEIDSTINLPFSDGFFAAVRACYSARATEPEFARLSFVLLGVATPDQLISDAKRTPFNVGRRIELEPFSLEEAEGLAAGLGDGAGDPLERILYWTGGQPYLTQAFCQLAAVESAKARPADPAALVDSLVEERFLTARALREETHLTNVQARLLAEPGARARLSLYRRVLRGEPVADSPTSPVVSALKLSGVVQPDEPGTLRVSNRLYELLFDRAWVRSKMPVDRARLVAAGTVAASLLGMVCWYAFVEPRSWIQQLELASEDHAVAVRAHEALSDNLLLSQNRADELFAQYWDRRARVAALRQDRDEALLYWLRATRAADTDPRRRHAAHLVGNDWDRLSVTLRHDAGVRAVAFSPDGTTVLTGSSDRTARLWQADSGAPIGDPMRHDDGVRAVAFSPDGTTVLTGSYDDTARLWQADSGAPIGDPMRHDAWVRAVAFSPDGRTWSSTGSWLHVSSVTPDGLRPIESRRARAAALDFPESCSPCDEITIAVLTAGAIRVRSVRLGVPPLEEPLTGDPADLLATWQERLALVFDDNGKVTPRWPVAPTRDPKSREPRSGERAPEPADASEH